MSRAKLLIALFLPLVLAPDSRAQGFGQGLLKGKRAVTLHRKLPATVALKGGTLGIAVSATDKQNTFAVDKLKETLEAELLKNNNQFKIDASHPETTIQCKITSLLIPPAKIVTRNVPAPVKVNGKMQTQMTPRQFQEITGSVNVAYEVKDAHGKVLDADNITAKYAQEFNAAGKQTGSGFDVHKLNPFKGKSGEEKAEEAVPTAPEIQQTLLKKVVDQITARLTTTDENVEVKLARGKLDQYNDFADKGLWNRMLEPLETMKPLDSKEDDGYRLYNIGVGYEALAYQAENNQAAKKYLDEAAINYGKAVDADPHEKEFLDAQNRITTAQAHYARLGNTASAVTAKNEPSKSAAPAASNNTSKASSDSSNTEALTNEQVIEFAKQGLDEENLVEIIKGAPKVAFDMSTNGQLELVKAGIKGKVLMAMRNRAHPVRRAPAAKPPAATASSAPNTPAPPK